jgi:hypothetical protein
LFRQSEEEEEKQVSIENKNTNESIRDDLDNYASRLPVYIEDLNGNLRNVEEITTRTLPEGPVVVIKMGGQVLG